MHQVRRFSAWTVVAPLTVLLVFAIAVLLVVGAVRSPAPLRGSEDTDVAVRSTEVLDDTVSATYRIRKGDTLSDVAERYGVPVDWIRSLNPQLDPLKLTVGTAINLRNPAAP